MVSFEHIKSNLSLAKQNSDQLNIPQAPPRVTYFEVRLVDACNSAEKLPGIKIPVYKLGNLHVESNGSYWDFQFTFAKQQTLLDSLLLAQWEDSARKGILKYDVMSCVTKVLEGKRKFVAQLNEDWNSGLAMELKKFSTLSVDSLEIKHPKEGILLCVTEGDKDISELTPAATIPKDCILVIVNADPAEYGHIHLLSYWRNGPASFLASLNSVVQFAAEINNCSFRVFYNQATVSNSGHICFQAFYFDNPLSVEIKPSNSIVPVSCCEGLQICEIADYPIKTMVFACSHDFKLLVEIVSEICSCLGDQNIPFNLLISESGRKIFLFLQARTLNSYQNLSAWECGGYFIFNDSNAFDRVAEEDIAKRMAAVSLDDEGFEAVKQLCCDIASRLAVPLGQGL